MKLWKSKNKELVGLEIHGAESYIKDTYGKRCKMTDREEFPDDDFEDSRSTRCLVCEQWEIFDEWKENKLKRGKRNGKK